MTVQTAWYPTLISRHPGMKHISPKLFTDIKPVRPQAFLQLVDKIARAEGDSVAVQSNNEVPPVHNRLNTSNARQQEPPVMQQTTYARAPEPSQTRSPDPAAQPSYTRVPEPAVIVVQSNNEPVMNYAQRESFSEPSTQLTPQIDVHRDEGEKTDRWL